MKEIANLGMWVETKKGSFLPRREKKLNFLPRSWKELFFGKVIWERGDGKSHGKEDRHTEAICRNFWRKKTSERWLTNVGWKGRNQDATEGLRHKVHFVRGLPHEKIRGGCGFAAEPFDWMNNMDPITPLQGRNVGEVLSLDGSEMSSPGGQTFLS